MLTVMGMLGASIHVSIANLGSPRVDVLALFSYIRKDEFGLWEERISPELFGEEVPMIVSIVTLPLSPMNPTIPHRCHVVSTECRVVP